MHIPHTAEVRAYWGLDYSRLIVNHGSFGATPTEVLEKQNEWRRRMEASPTLFMARELPAAIRSAADVVGAAIGARGQDIALVDNATGAINAILASFPFAPGDEILVTDHTYGAVLKTLRHVASRTGARIVTADHPFPNSSEPALVAAYASRLSNRTRLAIVDHITSHSATIMPVAAIARACRDAGTCVLVDGAHGPGQVPLGLEDLGVDFYVGNGHKWWMGAKGAAFMWVKPDRQGELHPTIISHGYGGGFHAEFDWTGTRDWSAALVLPDAIAFHSRLGGVKLMEGNRRLARQAGERLAGRFGSQLALPPEREAAMSLVELPLPGAGTVDRALEFRRRLQDLGCDCPVVALADRLWIRISAQAYNLPSDYDRLGDLIEQLLERRV